MIRLDVVNDGTGDEKTGNYNVTLVLPGVTTWRVYTARVEEYDRDLGFAELLRLAVDKVEVEVAV